MMVNFIDENRDSWGVEPICKNLQIAPSTYHEVKATQADPTRLSRRRRRDIELKSSIQRIWDENFQVYGPRKVWKQLRREGQTVGRGRIERLMREMGLKDSTRGCKTIRTTFSDPNRPTPEDLVQRIFHATAPNQLWVADFTYVATWSGVVYVAFVIDAYSKAIVGWRVSTRMTADLTLDALEQALWARPINAGLIHP